jgi:hypothetical protein
MHHPSENELALYAGNDLGRLTRLRVDWHLRSCGKCQQEVTEFSSQRAETVRSASEPDVNWNRLAAEMKANIRLGLEAGECIAPARARHRVPSPWAWASLVTAGLVAIAAGGEIWINHPWSLNSSETASAVVSRLASAVPQEVVLEFKDSGIQMRDGDSVTDELRNNSRGGVEYSVDAKSVGASYVDRETGMLTVDNISYGQ